MLLQNRAQAIFSLICSLNGNSLHMLSAHQHNKMQYTAHSRFPNLFFLSVRKVTLSTSFADVDTSVNDNLIYIWKARKFSV